MAPHGRIEKRGQYRVAYRTLLDLASGKEIRHIQTGDERYYSGFFTGDGRSLALAGNGKQLGLFALTTGKKLQGIEVGNAVAISSADGNWLATLGRNDHLVRLWDPHQGKLVRTLASCARPAGVRVLRPDQRMR